MIPWAQIEDNLNEDSKLGLWDRFKLNLYKNQLRTAFNWLNIKSSVIYLMIRWENGDHIIQLIR